MLINGANDRYWTLDALDLYWNELQGPKYLIEVPNAGHDLRVNRDWTTWGLALSFITSFSTARCPSSHGIMPRVGGDFHFTIRSNPAPQAARIWSAHSENRDFRESKWSDSPLKPGEKSTYHGQAPSTGRLALYGEVSIS